MVKFYKMELFKYRKLLITSIGFILFFLLIVIIDNSKKTNRLQKLKVTKQNWGIYKGEVIGVGITGFNFEHYNEKGQQFTLIDKTYFWYLKEGDTVLLKYSIEDPSIGEVIDPCYMQKHKGKSYCK